MVLMIGEIRFVFSAEKESEEVFGREQVRHQQRSEREMPGMRRGIAGKETETA